MKQQILLKRAYDPESPSDGFRVYIDRLWPRGLSHATFHYDLWDKDIAPSTELREWFHADPLDRWDEFSICESFLCYVYDRFSYSRPPSGDIVVLFVTW